MHRAVPQTSSLECATTRARPALASGTAGAQVTLNVNPGPWPDEFGIEVYDTDSFEEVVGALEVISVDGVALTAGLTQNLPDGRYEVSFVGAVCVWCPGGARAAGHRRPPAGVERGWVGASPPLSQDCLFSVVFNCR